MNNIQVIFETQKVWANNPQTNESVRDLRRRISYLEERSQELASSNEELILLDEEETSETARTIEALYLALIAQLKTLLDDFIKDASYASVKGQYE